MNLEIVKGDLFENVKEDDIIVHCVSADFALGAGFAKILNDKTDMRRKLQLVYPNHYKDFKLSKLKSSTYGEALIVDNVCNLVTKLNSYDKPTYLSLTSALDNLYGYCIRYNIKSLVMPKIGCGLDKLDWNNVKVILESKFDDLDIDIRVYYL